MTLSLCCTKTFLQRMSAVSFVVTFLPMLLYAQKYVNAPDNVTDWHYACNSTMCQDATINCPTDANCNILCDVGKGCFNAQIIWPTNGYGTISCKGDQSCEGVEFPIPDPNKNFTLNCEGVESCRLATDIYCPSNASCNINCIGDSSCHWSTIDWSQIGTGTISCVGLQSCYGVTMPMPLPNTDFTFNCPIAACILSTIYCPTDANCNIQCSDYDACKNAYIVCPINANCNITCSGINSCPYTNISWSNGINTLTCETNSCVNVTEIPLMSPTGIPTNMPTNIPTYSPSHSLTKNPSYSPSRSATNIPTQSPLRSPTYSPTNIPLRSPTYIPTYLPSNYPTYSPSVYTTNQFDDSEKQNSGFIALYIAGSMVLLCIVIFFVLITCKIKKSQTMTDVEMSSNVASSVPAMKVNSVSSTSEEHQHEEKVDFVEDKNGREPGKLTPGRDIDNNIDIDIVANVVDTNEEQQNELENWLKTQVELPEYYNVFIENGYEKLTFIAEIKTIQELYEIGIVKKGHQKRFMAKIEQLRNNNGMTPIGNDEAEGYAQYPTPNENYKQTNQHVTSTIKRDTNGNDEINANLADGEFIIT